MPVDLASRAPARRDLTSRAPARLDPIFPTAAFLPLTDADIAVPAAQLTWTLQGEVYLCDDTHGYHDEDGV